MPPIRLCFKERQYVRAIEELRAQAASSGEGTEVSGRPAVFPGIPRESITDEMVLRHAAIRSRGRNSYELQFRRSPQFRGEKYVGTYASPESAMEAVRVILESDNHLAAISRLYAANPRKRSGPKSSKI